MNFISDAVKLGRKIFDRRLYEEDIRQSAASRLPMDLLRDLLQRAGVRVDPDVELVPILPSALVYKETVSSPDIDDHSFADRER